MCYHRDRSRKVSQRPTERFHPRPKEIFKGQTSGNQALGQQLLGVEQTALCQ